MRQSSEGYAYPPSSKSVSWMRCAACGSILAVVGWTAEGERIRGGLIFGDLVRRPEPHRSGVARYGPVRRNGGKARHLGKTGRRLPRWEPFPARFYVNCDVCDRGQMMTLPTVLSPDVLESNEIADQR